MTKLGTPRANPPAGSPLAESFGADVSISESGATLYFVIAREGVPDAAVRSVGGEVLTRLASPRQALALAPLAANTGLSNHPDLELAGPVTVDRERFNRFARVVGVGRH